MTQPDDIHHIAANEGKTLRVLADRVTIKLGGDETRGGGFCLSSRPPE